MIKLIISGGQTGVDQGALDFAIERGIAHGGFCPKGRLCETGRPIPAKYNMWETASRKYPHRTLKNALYGNGTLIITRGAPEGGTLKTKNICSANGKPKLVIDLNRKLKFDEFVAFVRDNNIEILNVAGPRESKQSGIQKATRKALHELFDYLQKSQASARRTP